MRLLDIHELVSGYGEVQILRGASLALEAGKLTALVGSNGVGRDVTRVSTHEKAAAGLILVPEGRQLFTDMTVLENPNLGAVSKRAAPHRASNLKRVYELFPWLEARGRQRAGTLSGGEQQMLAVARALMEQPEALMFDELSLGLAPSMLLTLLATLRQLKRAELTMLLVEQNVRMALAVSDYAYVLREGAVWREGPAREVARLAEIQEAYLGA